MASIDSIEDLDVIEHEVTHPGTGEPLGTVINLAGPEHPERRKFVAANQRAYKLRVKKERDPMKALSATSPEEDEAKFLELACISTLGWKNFEYEGKALAFTPANVKRVYTERAWLRKQVLKVLEQDDLFTGSSATPSSSMPASNSN